MLPLPARRRRRVREELDAARRAGTLAAYDPRHALFLA
jgi:hypothetical protein